MRDRILNAAVAVLGRGGVKKLAQTRVAREAGIPQGHLTYYFPRKVDLLSAVARRFAELVGEDLRAILGDAAASRVGAAARRKAMGLASQLVKNRTRTRMLLGLLVEADDDGKLRDTMRDNAALVRSLLSRVMGRQEGDPDVDIALAAFWGLGIQHLIFRRSDAETDAILRRLEAWLERPPPAGVDAA